MRSRFRTTLLTLGAALAASALTAVPALASGAPKVETKPATAIAETHATVNGTVNPNNLFTKYYFEYGTTGSYGKKTAEVSAGSGTVSLEENAALTGLLGNTTYHFRIVATNSSGTTDGADEVFKTARLLPAFSKTLEGSPVSLGSFTVKGANPSISEYTEGWEVYCSAVTGSGKITGSKAGTISLVFTGCRKPIEEKCYSSTGKVGEIITEPLPFTLVYTSKEPTKQVALDINHNGGTIMSFLCGDWTTVLRGSILAPITPLNAVTKTFTATLTESANKQTPRENYNEELTGMEKSFPEVKFNETGWSEEAFIKGEMTLENFMKGGAKAEGKIEA